MLARVASAQPTVDAGTASHDYVVRYACAASGGPVHGPDVARVTAVDLHAADASTYVRIADPGAAAREARTHVVLDAAAVTVLRAAVARVLAHGPWASVDGLPEGMSCTVTIEDAASHATLMQTTRSRASIHPDALDDLLQRVSHAAGPLPTP